MDEKKINYFITVSAHKYKITVSNIKNCTKCESDIKILLDYHRELINPWLKEKDSKPSEIFEYNFCADCFSRILNDKSINENRKPKVNQNAKNTRTRINYLLTGQKKQESKIPSSSR